MKKIKIFRLDYFFWFLILATGAAWYLSDNSEAWMIAFMLSCIFYAMLTFFVRAIYLQSIKENNRVTQLSDIKKTEYDTSTWMEARAVIVKLNPLGKVMENEKEIGRLFMFQLEIEGMDGGRWRTLIKDYVVPLSHLTSFGQNTETLVLYNPEKKYREVIFSPEQKPWHYDKNNQSKN